jgi:hypothetical protein
MHLKRVERQLGDVILLIIKNYVERLVKTDSIKENMLDFLVCFFDIIE